MELQKLRDCLDRIDPATLTHDDRAALLSLVARSMEAKEAGGGSSRPSLFSPSEARVG